MSTTPREFPERPVVGVGAVVLTAAGRVVLVRRARPPLAGQWSLPGGVLEIGETLDAGLIREVHEETGLEITITALVETFEHIARDPDGRVRYHYVILDYLCRASGLALVAGSDASAVILADPWALEPFGLAVPAASVIRKACAMAGLTERGAPSCR